MRWHGNLAASAQVGLQRCVIGGHADPGGHRLAQVQLDRRIGFHPFLVREHGQRGRLQRHRLRLLAGRPHGIDVAVEPDARVALVDARGIGAHRHRRMLAVKRVDERLDDVGGVVDGPVGELVAGNDVRRLALFRHAHHAEAVDDVVGLAAELVLLRVLARLVNQLHNPARTDGHEHADHQHPRELPTVCCSFTHDGSPLHHELRHHGRVRALRLQQQFAHFAHGAAPTLGGGDVVHARQHLGPAIRHRHGKTDAGDDGQVDHVVADEAHLLGRETGFFQQRAERRQFVVAALVQVADAEVGRALDHLRRRARADDGRLHARLLQQLDAQAVVDVEGLERFAVGAVVQAAVGQHAVDIKDHQFDARGAFQVARFGHRITLNDFCTREVVDVQRAHQLAVGVGHQHLVDAELFHDGHGIHGQLFRADAARVGVHDIADHHLREVLDFFDHAAQVAVGEHADRAVVGIHDGGHAHALLGDFQQRIDQLDVGLHLGHVGAAAHDVAHVREQAAAQRATGVGAGKIFFLEAAQIEQRDGQRVAQRQRDGGGRGGRQVHRARFFFDGHVQVDVGDIGQARTGLAGDGNDLAAHAFYHGQNRHQLAAFARVRDGDERVVGSDHAQRRAGRGGLPHDAPAAHARLPGCRHPDRPPCAGLGHGKRSHPRPGRIRRGVPDVFHRPRILLAQTHGDARHRVRPGAGAGGRDHRRHAAVRLDHRHPAPRLPADQLARRICAGRRAGHVVHRHRGPGRGAAADHDPVAGPAARRAGRNAGLGRPEGRDRAGAAAVRGPPPDARLVHHRCQAPLAGTVHAQPAPGDAGRGVDHRAGGPVAGARRFRGRHAHFRDRIQAPGGRGHQTVPRRAAGTVLHHGGHAAQRAPGLRELVAGADPADRPGTGEVCPDCRAGQAVRIERRRLDPHRPGAGAGRRIRLRAAQPGQRQPSDRPVRHPGGAGLDGAVDADCAADHRQVGCDRHETGQQRMDDAVAGADPDRQPDHVHQQARDRGGVRAQRPEPGHPAVGRKDRLPRARPRPRAGAGGAGGRTASVVRRRGPAREPGGGRHLPRQRRGDHVRQHAVRFESAAPGAPVGAQPAGAGALARRHRPRNIEGGRRGGSGAGTDGRQPDAGLAHAGDAGRAAAARGAPCAGRARRALCVAARLLPRLQRRGRGCRPGAPAPGHAGGQYAVRGQVAAAVRAGRQRRAGQQHPPQQAGDRRHPGNGAAGGRRGGAARLRRRGTPRCPPFRARHGGRSRRAAPAARGPSGAQRRLYAAVAFYPHRQRHPARRHHRPGGGRTPPHGRGAGRARRRIHAPESGRHPRLRRAVRGGAGGRARSARVWPPHAAGNGPGVGRLRDPEHVAGVARGRTRDGLGVAVRSGPAGAAAGHARRRPARGRTLPGPRGAVLSETDAGTGRLGYPAQPGRTGGGGWLVQHGRSGTINAAAYCAGEQLTTRLRPASLAAYRRRSASATQLQLGREGDHGAGHAGADALGHEGGAVEIGVDQQHHEFLAAETRQRVRGAQLVLDAGGHFAQHLVAAAVTDRIVDAFKVVDVDVHERDRVRLALGAGNFLEQAAVDVAAVVHAGERIGQPDVLEHLVADHVFQADGDNRRHVLDEIRAQAGREAGGIAAGQVERADDALVAQQRHQRHALQPGRRIGKRGRVQGCLVHAQQRFGRRRRGRAVRQVEAERGQLFHENQVGKIFEHDIELEHHGADVGALVHEGERDGIEFGNHGQHAEDGAHQFGKVTGADDVQVERLVARHDRVVAFGLLQQVRHARTQCLVLGVQLVRARGLLAITLRQVVSLGNAQAARSALKRQCDVDFLPNPHRPSRPGDQDGVHTKAQGALHFGLGAVGLQDVERIGTELAGGLVDRRHRAARTRLDRFEHGVAEPEGVHIVFLERFHAGDDDIGAKTVHRQRGAAGAAQFIVEVVQRGLADHQDRVAVGKQGGGGHAAGPFLTDGARRRAVEAHQAARHAQRLAEPGSSGIAAIMGAQAVVPDMHAARGPPGGGLGQRHLEHGHAGEAQRQRVRLQGGRDQRHARKIALGHVAAVGIDHHPFAVHEAADRMGMALGGSSAGRQAVGAAPHG
uniref:Uncharacterized protein n=1 Tax=Tanacetum cinerariifolium TaxID=118510 RepID=A0A699GFK3_TANCI|nr:hypothetical protein [Tanacetum cinerariifolium]